MYILFAALGKLTNSYTARVTTCVLGRDVVLSCRLDYSGTNMVWMDEFDNVLYYNENHVIDDIRFKLSHSGTKWDLIIQNVTRRDAGKYRCFSNAQPLQLHYYYDLVVLEPAKIDRVLSSKDISVDERMNVSLVCNATGNPQPNVTWTYHRIDDPISEKRVKPSITLPNSEIYQDPGRSTELTCIISAYPLGDMYWSKNGVIIPHKSYGGKFRYENTTENATTHTMSLHIKDINSNDYGSYKCVASNNIGYSTKFMVLENLQTKYITKYKHQRVAFSNFSTSEAAFTNKEE
ncbi:hypothetical protein EB796_024639 [Bugula neritina]|uniref:Ig-like domain-containing protein n=1 Tax=Bugula neritina TaxID=10212 RepID=A0A7J7IT01_BUGNE|nr:hypothetical protein EB796_024639 [Bugula neritina]